MFAIHRACILLSLALTMAGCLAAVEDPASGATDDPRSSGAGSVAPPPQARTRDEKTVFLAQPPSVPGGLDSRSVLEATRSGILVWSANGGPSIRFVSDASSADVYTEYVKEWGGDRLGVAFSSGVLQIGLGNSQCNEKWTPFNAASLEHIAGHEMGHALGRDHSQDPGDIMYAVTTPSYARACEMFMAL